MTDTATLPIARESYAEKRDALEHYFDRTAAEAWRALTSDEKVSKIRATVRAGREEMRATLLGMIGGDLTGRRVFDAGCGTGALAVEAAGRGAAVTAIDVSPTMVKIARERTAIASPEGSAPLAGRVDFRAGDMVRDLVADPHGPVDHLFAMDSLIHYDVEDIVGALSSWAPRVTRSMAVTFAPKTAPLALMHAVGGLFPRGDRAPAIAPVAPRRLEREIEATAALADFRVGRSTRISRGFYTSQALELVRR